jgi:hypothetical protein
MYDIDEEFKGFSPQLIKKWHEINADKALKFQVSSPIVWSGFTYRCD